MTHAQRQAFLKTSSLGQLFGVAHLLPEVEDSKSYNYALSNQAKLVDVDISFSSKHKFQYEMLEPYRKGRGKWFRTVSWMHLYHSKLEKISSQTKTMVTV
ncbi:protochlorophyllide oxidoreductase [Nostoc sp. 'Lobaria pulmonaria (5183) cyanobiont']|uniref:protochlorophyllide oxidoreductase n=1 Tax=Nostoc sp. 'Lobaria pulmonaria (5183) cyanobiont' TaxID=1618022 RepID=UPI001F2764A9|nr:protochlorophyllide oxidoreductase [Nostoc sp. 'Lobaria pulmonaria (5183) cyanobiont']